MSFIWADALWLLVTLPVAVVCYVLILRRRSREALRFSSVGLVRSAVDSRGRIRRHVPPLLLLLAVVSSVLALARPTAVVTLPASARTVLMAIDTSYSMQASDVSPNRITAAQEAAKAFVQQQPSDVRIGLVSFAGSASLAQAPTRDKDDLFAAIDRLTLDGYTAIGTGIIAALSALFPEEDIAAQVSARDSHERAHGRSLDEASAPPKKPPARAVPPGSYKSAAIILLSDGRSTVGPHPLDVARVAADHGVRVFAVGFGHASGVVAPFDAGSMNLEFDEPTLKAIADLTRAEYFHAPTGEELKRIYNTLGTRLGVESETTEISALAAALSAAFLLAAAMLSVAWFGRAAGPVAMPAARHR